MFSKYAHNVISVDRVLSNGSIIHYSEPRPPRGKGTKVFVTCGNCRDKREVFTGATSKNTFTGLCGKCIQKIHPVTHYHGSESPTWKGGRIRDTNGYVRVHKSLLSSSELEKFGGMFEYDDYIREHRLVLARKFSRPLLPTEIVHHINGDKADNRDANLILVSPVTHGPENKKMWDTPKAEIKRLQAVLESHGIEY